MFPGDIDPWVAAVGSRLEFTANAGIPQNRILGDEVRDNDRDEAAERVLPVTTRWGLALLGLAAGETIADEDEGTAGRLDRQSHVQGKREYVRVDLGGRRII